MSSGFSFMFSGYSKVGKDECAGQIVRALGSIHVGLADPAKRHMMDTYGWTVQQLWGPSDFRNVGDIRYPKSEYFSYGLKQFDENSYTCEILEVQDLKPKKKIIMAGDPKFWLSPREALQKYMGLMNDLYKDTWIRYGVELHKKLSLSNYLDYERETGVIERLRKQKVQPQPISFSTTFSDFRHWNEINYSKAAKSETFIPILIRVKRPSIPKPPYDHRSETEQEGIPDSEFHFVIDNDSDLDSLYSKINDMISFVLDVIPNKTVYI